VIDYLMSLALAAQVEDARGDAYRRRAR